MEKERARESRTDLNELGMAQPLHDGGLLKELGRLHGPRLEGLDSHVGGAVPDALPHITKLTRPELAQQPDCVAGNFPLRSQHSTLRKTKVKRTKKSSLKKEGGHQEG